MVQVRINSCGGGLLVAILRIIYTSHTNMSAVCRVSAVHRVTAVLELSTNIRNVSQNPEKALIRAFSLLKATTTVDLCINVPMSTYRN